jgi:hypothetical protein
MMKKSDKKKAPKSKSKSRPTCKKDSDKSKQSNQSDLRKNTKYKYMVLWLDKLENMSTILTLDNGMCIQSYHNKPFIEAGMVLDEYEKGLKRLKDDMREGKNMLLKRKEELEHFKGRTKETVSRSNKVNILL